MTTNRKLSILAIICAFAATGIYGYAFLKDKAQTGTMMPESTAPMGKAAASAQSDGRYTVQIRSVMATPEDTIISFKHVTYFEGEEARTSAAHDANCKDEPIDSCVPTLARGYYVRPSGALDFTAPLTASSIIVLKDNDHASVSDLRNLSRPYEPVFDAVIAGGNIVSITERTPLPGGKG